ncbi:MAG TPA: urease accessory protein UreF [Vicinamibacterales bacterium]|jgi:urease accessory protein
MKNAEHGRVAPRSLIRLQHWLSPVFPTGAYSYSHGLEWAIESNQIHDRAGVVDWLDADLRFGSARNDAIFFVEAWRCAAGGDHARLLETAELAAACRATSEFALEASQQGASCLATLREVWRDPAIDALLEGLRQRRIPPALPIVIAVRSATEGVPVGTALCAFVYASVSNIVTASVRLIPLGQTDGQRALAELERSILDASERALTACIDDLGSAALMVDFASMLHETQYTRLFRS